MIIASFFLISIVFFYIRLMVRKWRMMKYVGHLRGPKEYPIIGSGLKFLGKNTEGYINYMIVQNVHGWINNII